MCGIAGGLYIDDRSFTDMQSIVSKMIDKLNHRGPDDKGVWIDSDTGISLSHSRLAIMDLSFAGHQPMPSPCGCLVIVFNGEIYNHIDIRKELTLNNLLPSDFFWKGTSDTETLLMAIKVWGVSKTLSKLIGMFAFALWDYNTKSLTIARDRMGEKPLYYGLQDRALMFASELKSIHAIPTFNASINQSALSLYLQNNMVPAPSTIYNGIYKLLPGTYLTVKKDDIIQNRLPKPTQYWGLDNIVQKGLLTPFSGSKEEAVFELDRLIKQSISGQMIADVSLGAFLSGGVDSTTIVALMQSQSIQPIQTFTAGFYERGYNEANYAKEVANYLGTNHTELYVTQSQMLDCVPKIPQLYDEPFADASQIPTYLISRLTRQHVTVSLSGDGGDELFGGYNRYISAVSIWNKCIKLPYAIRMLIAGILTTISPSAWDSIFYNLRSVLPRDWQYQTPGNKVYKLSSILTVKSAEKLYNNIVSNWKQTEHVLVNYQEKNEAFSNTLNIKELEHRMMYLDSISYLPDDILVKVDRASMGASLESRVPFLDHRIVEFAWTLPLTMKIHQGQGKWILRKVLNKYIPSNLVDRPKSGFDVPIDHWLRGPLKKWAEELINPSLLKEQGFFVPEIIQRKWLEHLSGKKNCSHQLWAILMFQAWLIEYNDK